MAWANVRYVASNGQETSSENEGMCYEDIADITDSEIELTESDMKRNSSKIDITPILHYFYD